MIKKILLSLSAAVLMNVSHAAPDNLHFSPKLALENAKNLSISSPCLIKITNDSQYNVIVSGEFDDGSHLSPFIIYAYEDPQYISLYYYNICHGVMGVSIETASGLKLYQQETYVNSRIRIKSGWLNPYVIFDATK